MRSHAYARGRRAWGMDARTGERVLLRELVRDGQTHLPVTRSSYDPRHPQERVPDVFDPQALRRPAPDLDNPPYEVAWPTGPWDELRRTYPPLVVLFQLGEFSIQVVGGVGEQDVYEMEVYEPGVYA